jgi:hypothetical protein
MTHADSHVGNMNPSSPLLEPLRTFAKPPFARLVPKKWNELPFMEQDFSSDRVTAIWFSLRHDLGNFAMLLAGILLVLY